MDSSYIPQILNNFNAYDNDANKYLGLTDEVTLPDLQAKTETVAGAGMAGEADLPVPGQFGALEMTMNSKTHTPMYYAAMKSSSTAITLRGSINVVNPATGEMSNVGLQVETRSYLKSANGGSMKVAGTMGNSITREVIYYKVTFDGETVIEIDKFNNVCIIDGVDQLASVNNQI